MSTPEIKGELHEGKVVLRDGRVMLEIYPDVYFEVGNLVMSCWEGRRVRVTVDVEPQPLTVREAAERRPSSWPQPKNDWILVRTDPLPEKNGSILLPSKGTTYTATVLAVGPGAEIPLDHNQPEKKRFISTDVKPGEKIAFLRWAIESQQGKAVGSTFEDLGADIALIKERDILFVLELEPGEKVELSL